jgi:hypothetical protein
VQDVDLLGPDDADITTAVGGTADHARHPVGSEALSRAPYVEVDAAGPADALSRDGHPAPSVPRPGGCRLVRGQRDGLVTAQRARVSEAYDRCTQRGIHEPSGLARRPECRADCEPQEARGGDVGARVRVETAELGVGSEAREACLELLEPLTRALDARADQADVGAQCREGDIRRVHELDVVTGAGAG